MSTNKLKSFARRSTMLVAAAALVAGTIAPAAVFADSELTPLTERSLLLSSSAPGWQDTDGSGYSTENPNPAADGFPATYAPAGSGANGRKTGQTFTFRVSTDSVVQSKPIQAFTLQYCTQAAGNCQAPGNNSGDARNSDRMTNEDALDLPVGSKTSDLEVNYPANTDSGAAFTIRMGADKESLTDVSDDWVLNASNLEDNAHSGTLTGKNNFITLSNSVTGISPTANTLVEIKFNASEAQYITNPGADEFFVKMNTYEDAAATTRIDGGVTVANVMTDSIHITTKVLETMQFSVGTTNPDTEVKADPVNHGTCEPITTASGNRLQLGNPDAEFSLETTRGYGVESFWRLSSNSSGGATVYYSGETLTNTVGDFIEPIGGASPGTKVYAQAGTAQFGLAFKTHRAVSSSFNTQLTAEPLRYQLPDLYVLQMEDAYADGDGTLGEPGTPTGDAQFAFDRGSITSPVPIADNTTNGGVLTCETAEMRYVANIAADTPAGVYTTKINYLAAPQY